MTITSTRAPMTVYLPGSAPAQDDPPPSYLGPLDKVPVGILAAYSTSRALSAAMLGQTIFSIKKLDGGAEPTQAFAANVSTALAPTADVVTFLDANPGLFTNLVDHTGNGFSLIDPTDTMWDADVLNGHPGIHGLAGGQIVKTATTVAYDTGATVIALISKGVELASGSIEGQLDFYTADGAGSSFFTLINNGSTNDAGATVDGNLPAGLKVYVPTWRNGARTFSINGVSQAVTDFDEGPIAAFSTDDISVIFNEESELIELYLCSPEISGANISTLISDIMTFHGLS